uniref:Uncharacterized protein n=1 Tax=Eptatretus burgeri TaxID=7764 RepID=A0A8C4QUE4_EPTBU
MPCINAAFSLCLSPPLYYETKLFEPESCTYSYLLACKNTHEAVILDPVRETARRDAKLVQELGLNLKYASMYSPGDCTFLVVHEPLGLISC